MYQTPCWHFSCVISVELHSSPIEEDSKNGGVHLALFFFFFFYHISELPDEAEIRLTTPQEKLGLDQTCRDLRA